MYPPPYPPGAYPPPPPPDPAMFGVLELKLSFFPLMWILYLISPMVSINGVAQQRRWGVNHWTLPAGRYQVEAWYPYMFKKRTSPAGMVVDIYPQQVTALTYRPSWLTFLAGTMRFVGLRGALPPPPPGMLPPGRANPPA